MGPSNISQRFLEIIEYFEVFLVGRSFLGMYCNVLENHEMQKKKCSLNTMAYHQKMYEVLSIVSEKKLKTEFKDISSQYMYVVKPKTLRLVFCRPQLAIGQKSL